MKKKTGGILVERIDTNSDNCHTIRQLIQELQKFSPESRVGVFYGHHYLTVAPPKPVNAPVKKPRKKPFRRTHTPGLMKPVIPSEQLAAIVGKGPMPRTEITKKLWAYIKKHNLQDKTNRRNINTDDKLRAIFKKSSVNMFEMTKLVAKHCK